MSTPTPADKSAEKFDHSWIIDIFKDLVGFDLNTILSLVDPEIDDAAEKLAIQIKKKWPKNHWLFSKPTARGLAVLSSRVEKATKGQPQAAQDVAEKISDFLDSFRRSLNDQRADNSMSSHSATAVKEAETFTLLEERFLKRAEKDISEAKVADIAKVKAGLKKEYGALVSIRALVEKELDSKAPKTPEPPKKRTKSLAQTLRPINAELKTTIKKWKSTARKLERKSPPRKTNIFEKVVDLPGKIVWNFLMPK